MQGIRESAGWGPASWWPRSNFVEFKDTNRSPSFSGNWRRCFPLGRRLSNGERHRREGYARAATFHGVSGDSSDLEAHCDVLTKVKTSSGLGRYSYEPTIVIGTYSTTSDQKTGLSFVGYVLGQVQRTLPLSGTLLTRGEQPKKKQ